MEQGLGRAELVIRADPTEVESSASVCPLNGDPPQDKRRDLLLTERCAESGPDGSGGSPIRL